MKITELSVKRPLMIGMIFLGLIVFGAVSLVKLPVDLFPNITFPMMIVLTGYPGAGPQEIETQVTEPFEKMLGTINNVDQITSTSSDNNSVIMLQFDWGTNLDAASNDVRDRLGLVTPYLSADINQPMIFKFDISQQPVVMYSVTGAIDPLELDRIATDIADELQRVGGVAASYAMSGSYKEIQVVLDPLKMAASGVTADQVNSVLQAQNLNYPLGTVESGTKAYLLRLIGEYKSLEDIGRTVVGNQGGVPILLKQVAKISASGSETSSISRTNGKPSIWSMIQKRTDANTIKVCAGVIKSLDEIKKNLPPGVEIAIIFNQADFINRSVKSTGDSLIIGGLLAVLILFLFLGNLRSTIFVAVSIPITVFFTLFLMFLFGMTLNIISLSGLTIAIGMVVDAAIVVFEAVYRHRHEKKEDLETAAIKGTSEVGMAITASTLTTVAVFLPLLLVRGFASIFFTPLALTVTFALMSSLVVAITIVPMFMSKFLRVSEKTSGLEFRFMDFYKKVENAYSRLITWSLNHRRRVIWITAILFITSLALFPFIGAELTPDVDQGEIQLQAEMPLGTRLAVTDSAVIKLERILEREIPETINSFVTIGSGSGMMALFGNAQGSHTASVWIGLNERSQRKRSVKDIQRDLRTKLTGIPGMTVRFTSDQSMFMGSGKPIEIKILGYDRDRAREYTERLMDTLKLVKGLVDIESDMQFGKPEIQFRVDRYKAMQFGMTPYQIGNALRGRIEGVVATKYRVQGTEYDVKILTDKQYRDTPQKIASMTITTPLGEVPLRNFLLDTVALGPAQINHDNATRVVKITASVEGRDQNSVAGDVRKILSGLPRPADFRIEMAGGFKQMQDTFRDLGLVIILSLFLVYIIMVAQFESLREPFIIMFTIPLAIIGVMWILFFTKTTFNMQSLLGVLLLGGVVVNNAIVYVDYVNQLRRSGLALFPALAEAGRVRLRPILMTTLTTIFGLVPMALGTGSGNEMRAPMARSVIGGLTVSTFLTLIFIPVLYAIFELRAERKRQGVPQS